MTGGTVVVLGETGRNFAAGMSGGIAYVYDEHKTFETLCNTAMVNLEPVTTAKEQEARLPRALWHMGEADENILKGLIEKHLAYTGSTRAKKLLESWAAERTKFVKVFPNEYRRALGEINAAKEAATTIAQAKAPAAAKV